MRMRRKGNRADSPQPRREVTTARGGFSPGSVATGAVIAMAATGFLGVAAAAAFVGLGIQAEEILTGDSLPLLVAATAALLTTQFLAYLWGGYTAGRMARGAGLANGVFVPFLVIILGAVVLSLGRLDLASPPFRLPPPGGLLSSWGIGISSAALVAMFLGAILGGWLGSRWHLKLEASYEARRSMPFPGAKPGVADLWEAETE
ncbi:MAG: hypothetical protein ACRDIF_07680 [Actinomycetota bacterium]